MRSPYPALSIWRPWTTLILEHGKNVENRPWRTTYSGGHLYVHGAKTWQGEAAALFMAALGVAGISPIDADHPTGIVGLVELVGICAATVGPAGPRVCDCGPWAVPGDYHWRLANSRPFPRPVPCRGRQGLWWPTGDLADALAEVA